jgi:hypothetical protein
MHDALKNDAIGMIARSFGFCILGSTLAIIALGQ